MEFVVGLSFWPLLIRCFALSLRSGRSLRAARARGPSSAPTILSHQHPCLTPAFTPLQSLSELPTAPSSGKPGLNSPMHSSQDPSSYFRMIPPTGTDTPDARGRSHNSRKQGTSH